MHTHMNVSASKAYSVNYLSGADTNDRLLLKAGCAPCLAGCRWYGICTKWVENLLFEVILMVFSSIFRPET